MNNEIVVLQGKTFFIELQSMLGSTNYGWCVKSIPEEVILIGMESIPVKAGVAPVIQRIYFGAVSAGEEGSSVEINFGLNNLSNLSQESKQFTAKVKIIACGTDEFEAYSENDEDVVSGIVYLGSQALKYGYPCSMQDTLMKYGYPCGVQDAALKYGYPCSEYTKDARPYGFALTEED